MGGGMPNFTELRERNEARAQQSRDVVLPQRDLHPKMNPHNIQVRECLLSDSNPNPLPVACFLDTTGSMGHVPEKLAKEELTRLLQRFTQMGSVGQYQPQVCFCGVADVRDTAPLQVGQFEADNRMDEDLTRLHLGGGGGSDRMQEAYVLALYFLARKTTCDIWKKGEKGFAFIVGDEMSCPVLSSWAISQIFGDHSQSDLSIKKLLIEVQEKWNFFFLYTDTNFYGGNNGQEIWEYWHKLLGKHAVRLDGEATGLPEIMSALIGINDGVFKAEDVPADLRDLGCEEKIVHAAAQALNVSPGKVPSDQPKSKKRRGPTPL